MNIIIVESENDKYFVEALIEKMNLSIQIETTPICIDNYECLEGDSLAKLKASIDVVRNRAKKESITSVGIILDQDKKTSEERLEQTNSAIKESFEIEANLLEKIGEFKSISVDETVDIKLGLYLQNVSGSGNLESVLKEIKNKDSNHADCLEAWRDCIKKKGLEIKQTDFDKFWVNIYIRYDQCTKKEQKQAGRKCNNEASMKKDIWDYDHASLKSLKTFLQTFESPNLDM